MGLKYIKDNYKTYIIITMDSDGQHTVADAIKLSDECIKHNNALILGKRLRSNKTPLRSRFGNTITRFVYRITTGIDIYDTQTGLRAFSNKLTDFLINIEGERFEYEMNVLLEAPHHNIELIEIKIDTIYIDNNSGSHFNTLKDSFLIYKNIIKFSFSSIFSFLIDYLFYVIFLISIKKILLSNILARAISSIVNYNINRKLVFDSKKKVKSSVFKYFSLVALILILNTFILNLILCYTNVNALLAKILTEILSFIISFLVQQKFIFKE